ncbi:MAG: hypothetical protein H0V90_07800 [Blastocatellia bacterium]|nr:hypothetical protein [Blastocatellia bacterium]
MPNYTKLFHSILASTIWRADDKTRIVWITLLAMSDKDGICEGSIPGLADMARVSIEDCELSLHELMTPDPYSRTPDFEGRRIEAVVGTGWRLLNHAKYRNLMSAEERREYQRNYQSAKRAKEKARQDSVINSSSLSTDVNNPSSKIIKIIHSDTDTDTDTDIRKEKTHKKEKNRVFVSDAEQIHVDEILDGLRTRYHLITLRDEPGWLRSSEWAYENNFSPDQFLECFDLLNKQHWRTGPITGKTVADNLPNLEKLKGEQQNGINQPNSEREKSAARNANAERLADELERVGRAEIAAELAAAERKALSGNNDSDSQKGHLISQRSGFN